MIESLDPTYPGGPRPPNEEKATEQCPSFGFNSRSRDFQKIRLAMESVPEPF